MMQLNKFVGAGHLTRDPELRYTPNGKAVASVPLAINERYTVEGDERSTVSFIDINVFGRSAETLKNLTSKGTEILIEGSLKQDNWVDKNTGQNRSKIVINCSNWQFTQKLRDGVEKILDQPAGVDR